MKGWFSLSCTRLLKLNVIPAIFTRVSYRVVMLKENHLHNYPLIPKHLQMPK